MTKIFFLKTFLLTKKFMTHNWFQCTSHYIEVKPFILNINNNVLIIWPHLSNKFVKLWTKVYLIVFIVANKLIMTCFGYQSLPKVNTSYAPLNIHKSKFNNHKITLCQCWKNAKPFSFLHQPYSISCENDFSKRKLILGHTCI